jgi:hypothetical protein
MGSGNFDVKAYEIQAKEAKTSQNSGFIAASMCDEFNPSSVSMRFSKKGPFNEFRDVITVLIGLDVTGSMDVIPKSLLQGKLGSLMVDLKKTFGRPNENLQISFAGIGDAKTDEAPLQVTHFESDNRFAQQLQKIWLEGHGGGNGAESYNLLWLYAANKTQLNYVKQDKRKGILITIGDDNVHPSLTAGEIQMWFDPKYEGGDISNQDLLKAAREQYEVYHIIITDGQSYRYDMLKKADKTDKQKKEEAKQWTDLLGLDNLIHSKSTDVADAIADIIKRHRPLEKVGMMNLEKEKWDKQNKENLTDEQWAEVLSYTVCPLTRKFMNHPVDWSGGKRAYEKEAVEKYVSAHQKDPITQRKLISSELVLKPNLNIAQLCSNYRLFFNALSESRREHLIQLTFPSQVSIEHEKIEGSGKYLQAFFSKNGSESKDESVEAVKKLDEIHSDLECPILHTLMEDPVSLGNTGQTYERKAIEDWLKNHDTDPNTRKKLESEEDKKLVPNYLVKRLCDAARSALKPQI